LAAFYFPFEKAQLLVVLIGQKDSLLPMLVYRERPAHLDYSIVLVQVHAQGQLGLHLPERRHSASWQQIAPS